MTCFKNVTTVDVYADLYEPQNGANQDFNGVKLASLSGSSISNGMLSASVDVSHLLPTQYYVYAIINDQTNTPVTSLLTAASNQPAQVFEPEYAILGTASNQNGTALSGWTVTAEFDSTTLTTTTNDQGFYGFQPNAIPQSVPVTLSIALFDPNDFVFSNNPSGGTYSGVQYVGSTLAMNFTLNEKSAIQGIVLDDATQEGLSNWVVFIDANGNHVLDPGEITVSTDPSGNYSIPNIGAGTYNVALALQNGSAATYTFDPSRMIGPTVLDSSGSANTQSHVGSLEDGAAVGTAGSFGISDHPHPAASNQVVKLNGTSSADVPTFGDLEPGRGDFSAAGWVRVNSATGKAQIAGLMESGASSGGWELGVVAGTFGFAAQQAFAAGSGPQSIVRADFNGDGKRDLAVANAGSNSVSVLLNTTAPGATAPSFVAQQFAAGTTPRNLVVGDFNGDGRLDLATNGSSTVAVLLNTTAPGATTPSFAGQVQFTVASAPLYLAVADFNGDGKLDVTTANSTGSVSVLLNKTAAGATTPSFAVQQFTAAGTPWFVAAADINNDGKADLAVLNHLSNTVSILLNTTAPGAATASFTAQQQFAVGSSPVFLAIGDLNGDGKSDLVVANETGNMVSVLINTTVVGTTSASFTAQLQLAVGVQPESIVLADFNGDGKSDLAVNNATGNSVSVFLNTAAIGATTASFAAQQTFAVESEPWSIAVEDFNNDGKPDLVSTNAHSNNVSVLLNTAATGAGTAAFATQQTFSVGQGADFLTVDDFNGDGLPDIATSNSAGNNVSVLLNQSLLVGRQFGFAAQQQLTVGTWPSSVAEADFNGDGKADLVAVNINSNTVSLRLNTMAPGATAASFAGPQQFTTGTFPEYIVVTDFNLDGRPDIAVTNFGSDNLSVLINTTAPGATTASFAAQKLVGIAAQPEFIVTADFNGDGKPDLATANVGSDVSVILNTTVPGSTTANFAAAQTLSAQSLPVYLVAADFNGDGKPDLATANASANSVSVMLNTTAPGATVSSFTAQKVLPVGSFPVSIAAVDFNGDGKTDLVTANQNSNNISVLLNTTVPGATTANFASQQSIPTGNGPSPVTIADFNGDGKADVAVANLYGNSASVLLNATAPGATAASFAPQLELAAGFEPLYLAVEDFNGDGKLDLAVSNSRDSFVSILLNTTATDAATPSFSAQKQLTAGTAMGQLVVADFNNDGKRDLLVGSNDESGTTIAVLLNTHTVAPFSPYVSLVQNSQSGSGALTLTEGGINADTWYHVAFAYDPVADANGDGTGAGTLSIYINGVLVATSDNRGSLAARPDISSPSGVDFVMGDKFVGFLDEVSVWDAALTATQVQSLFNGTTSPSYSQTIPTSPSTYTLTIDSSGFDVKSGNNFTVAQTATVSGVLTGNSLVNGRLDRTPHPLAGWTVNLLDANGQVAATGMSAGDGRYLLAGAVAGIYRLQVVVPNGWRSTSPLAEAIDLGPGQVLVGQDFTHAQWAVSQVNGLLFDDDNRNGVRDLGEIGREGATAFLDVNRNGKLDKNEVSGTTVTGGAYSLPLAGIRNGVYPLRFETPQGRLLTSPASGAYSVTIVSGVVSPHRFFDFGTIPNSPPTITSLTTTPALERRKFTVSAKFTDSDSTAKLHRAVIDWGDGTITSGLVRQPKGTSTVTASHVYAAGGFYEATLTIIDGADDSVTTTRRFTAIISGAGVRDGVLQILGTDHNDHVVVTTFGRDGYRVTASFLPGGSKTFRRAEAAGIASLELFLFNGNDRATISPRIPVPVSLDDGAGKDTASIGTTHGRGFSFARYADWFFGQSNEPSIPTLKGKRPVG